MTTVTDSPGRDGGERGSGGRDVFHISRVMEFFSEPELAKEIGHARPSWPAAVAKELLDNALDAAERTASPKVGLAVGGGRLSVSDNGPGIPPQVVEDSLDYGTRTTDKAFYVAPTRGRQGVGLKTVWAVPFVVGGGRGVVEVEAHGTRRVVEVAADPLDQRPHITTGESPSAVKTGTRFTLHWPDLASDFGGPDGSGFYRRDGDDGLAGGVRGSPVVLVRAFAMFNPHVRLRLADPGGTVLLDLRPRDAGFRKWVEGDGTPPHWYTPQGLANLAAAKVRADRERDASRTVRDFVGEFPGLSSTVVRKKVCEAAGTSGPLAGLFAADGLPDPGRFESLHEAMCAAARVRHPRKLLGVIGREGFAAGLSGLFGCDGRTHYQSACGVADGVPYVLEVGLGYRREHDQRRLVVAGVNWSPVLRTPFEVLADALQDARVDEWDPVVLAVHLAYPGATPTDRGKSRYELPDVVRDAMADLVSKVSADWTARKARAERDRRRVQREAFADAKLGRRSEKVQIKRAAYAVMAEAYRLAAAGVGAASARQVMYQARPLVQARTGGRDWGGNSRYFTQTLLPDFMAANPGLTAKWDVHFDDRGHFAEPHTGRRIGVGTLAVRGYIGEWDGGDAPATVRGLSLRHDYPTAGPRNRYQFALLIEKEGFAELLGKAKIAERYDIAIWGIKGLPTTACRRLVEQLTEAGVTIFVLHDFDRAGLFILNTLRNDTRRYQFRRRPNVVDLGLRLADVRRMGLPPEAVRYVMRADPRTGLLERGATRDEADFLVRLQSRPKRWEGERVELNAMSSAQLVGFLEAAFAAHGVAKFVPAAGTLKTAYARASRIARVQGVVHQAVRKANAAKVAPPPHLAADVKRFLADHPAASWDEAVWKLAKRGTK